MSASVHAYAYNHRHMRTSTHTHSRTCIFPYYVNLRSTLLTHRIILARRFLLNNQKLKKYTSNIDTYKYTHRTHT